MPETADARTILKQAITAHAIVRPSVEHPIIQSEQTGAPAAWLMDMRPLLLNPLTLNAAAQLFWETWDHAYPFQIGGLESASIPLITAIILKGETRGTPVNGFYIRKSRKREGRMQIIEGSCTDAPVILVDDLINSGNSFAKQCKVLDAHNKTVHGIFALVRFRNQTAYQALPEVRTVFTLAEFGLALNESAETTMRQYEIAWEWKGATPSRHLVLPKSAPAIDSTHVYFGTDDGVFHALSQHDGTECWRFETLRNSTGKGILSSPITHNELVYFGAYDGSVYALETATGKKRWSYDDADWVGSSPALSLQHNILYVGLEFGLFRKQGGIVALDATTGEKRWSDAHEHFTHGSPLVIDAENIVVIGSNNGVVYGYESRTGKKLWATSLGAPVKAGFAFSIETKLMYCGTIGGHCYGLRLDGSIAWIKELRAGMYSTPCVYENLVIIGTLDKYVYALNNTDGSVVWEHRTAGRIFASPVLGLGSVWIGSNDGVLYELNPVSGKMLGSLQCAERMVNRVVLNKRKGTVFIVTQANECIAIKNTDPWRSPF